MDTRQALIAARLDGRLPNNGTPQHFENLLDAIEQARGLHEPGEPPSEYTRGQAELIADLYGLGMDDYREVIIDLIVRADEPEPEPSKLVTVTWTITLVETYEATFDLADLDDDTIEALRNREMPEAEEILAESETSENAANLVVTDRYLDEVVWS